MDGPRARLQQLIHEKSAPEELVKNSDLLELFDQIMTHRNLSVKHIAEDANFRINQMKFEVHKKEKELEEMTKKFNEAEQKFNEAEKKLKSSPTSIPNTPTSHDGLHACTEVRKFITEMSTQIATNGSAAYECLKRSEEEWCKIIDEDKYSYTSATRQKSSVSGISLSIMAHCFQSDLTFFDSESQVCDPHRPFHRPHETIATLSKYIERNPSCHYISKLTSTDDWRSEDTTRQFARCISPPKSSSHAHE